MITFLIVLFIAISVIIGNIFAAAIGLSFMLPYLDIMVFVLIVYGIVKLFSRKKN